MSTADLSLTESSAIVQGSDVMLLKAALIRLLSTTSADAIFGSHRKTNQSSTDSNDCVVDFDVSVAANVMGRT